MRHITWAILFLFALLGGALVLGCSNDTPPPSILSFTPTSGTTSTTVTITGTNFSSASSVTFNGAAASYNVNSDTSITAIAPAGVTTGPIAVTTPGGTDVSDDNFVVIPPG
ncbi:MAG: IPT/TIG domain-containing protein [Armatimonadota bacterium]